MDDQQVVIVEFHADHLERHAVLVRPEEHDQLVLVRGGYSGHAQCSTTYRARIRLMPWRKAERLNLIAIP